MVIALGASVLVVVTHANITQTYAAAFVLVPAGGTWKYLDNGTDPGPTWTSLAFNDSAWASGPAPLGYGDPVSTTINGGPESNRFITTYFRHIFTPTTTSFMQLNLNLRRDDGAVVYLNGVEVARSNMPAGAIVSSTLASSSTPDETTFFPFSIPTTTLLAGSNILAVELHQSSPTTSDAVFDLSLVGEDTIPTATPTATTMNTPTNTPTPTTPPFGTTALVLAGSGWKYLDNGSDQGTGWIAPLFDDSTWAQGPAPLGYGDPVSTTVISGTVSGRFITTYFRKSFTVTNPSDYLALTLYLRRDDGAVVYLNGTEVARSNMPVGAGTYQTLAASTVGGVDETAFFQFDVLLSNLQAGTNVLAVELHQASIDTTDAVFDLSLIAANAEPAPTPTGTLPTPTNTPTPTPTGTITPPTSTPTQTPTTTGAPDPRPNKMYLPIVQR